MREYELTQQRMIEHYKRCTGQDDQTIRDFLLPAQDRWLSGEEALKLRICDAISVVEQNNNPAPKPKTKGRT
jgi:ATP-dependent protease ClpP protease subunit